MICRHEKGGWLIISQLGHAWLAGELAAAWGNEDFTGPTPRSAVILATHLHDIGWLDWDAAPRLNPDGQPVNFLDTNLEETIPMWRQGVQQVATIDPYAALLISEHARTIYRRRLERQTDPPEKQSEVKALLAEQSAVQERFRAQLADHPIYGPSTGSEHLHAAYRWLRACDLLSLALCSDALPQSGEIANVPAGGPTDLQSIHYTVTGPFSLVVTPSPFARSILQQTIQARWVAELSYPSQEAFHAALRHAPWVDKTITIQAA